MAETEARSCFVYDTKGFVSVLDEIQVSEFMKSKSTPPPLSLPVATSEGNLATVPLDDLRISDTLYCSYCSTGFLDKEAQRSHYKLDWHRYNLKQAIAQKKTVSEEKFSQIVDDDMSSISGSETEDETETDTTDVENAREEERLKHLIARRSRVLFSNSCGQVISVHRCLLLNKKEEAASDDHLVSLMKKLPYRTTWLVVMMGGGHFAAALFKGGEAILHKTFHSYTVRKAQGGSQSTKDNKGTHAKSAGSSLRRYNEQSLAQHIQELMKTWGPDIVKCDLIFYRAVGRSNMSSLFGGPSAPLLKADPRLRTIPFPTRRPTFSEVQRVHSLLAMTFIYDSNEMFKTSFHPLKIQKDEFDEKDKRRCKKNGETQESGSASGSPRKSHIDRGKERPSPVRELPGIIQQLAAISTSGSEGDTMFMREEEVSFLDLREYEDTVPQEVKDRVSMKKRKKKKKMESGPEKESMREELQRFWKEVHGACARGDLDALESALETPQVTKEEVSMVLNQRNVRGETVLHQMAGECRSDTVRLLLVNGADPCIKDKKAQTAYDHAGDKPTRNVFRRFMGEFPDLHDYSKVS
uniref:Ankyrin repeat and zinc finger domain-containing protein 1 n=1 Tax=Lygus hesperus TaxID=30085 RepID=A0A0A9W064_LYGHE